VLDDLVLLKSDGFPTYHLANVVDDHCMKISHVLRGDEWIASTPRHILIYEAFGWEPPKFAHMPVILSPSGGKLSKRKGAASVMDYRQSGFLPEALFNFLTFLGWSPGEGDEREKMTRDELVKMFSIEHITPKSAVFDEKKLEWMNGKYMEERSSSSLVNEVKGLMKDKSFLNGNTDDAYLETVIGLLKSRSKRITDIMDNGGYFFKDPVTYEEKAAGKYFNAQAAEILKGISGELSGLAVFDKTTTENIFKKIAETRNIPFGSIIHPARLAVSGGSFGPGLFELMEVLGKDAVVRRINAAIKVMC
jgi:glutamyl-tRNA synthetase